MSQVTSHPGSLEKVLRDLAATSSTGCLLVRDPEGDEAEVFLRDGEIYSVTVPGRRPMLGVRLMSSASLTREALAEALEIQRTELQGWRLGELLVHLGYVDLSVVEEFVVEQLKDGLVALLGWPVAAWKFRKNKKTRQDVAPPSPVASLLADLRDRATTWGAILAVIGGSDSTPRLAAGSADGGGALGPNERALLSQVDGAHSVADLAGDCGFTLFEAGQVVATLVETGLLEIDGHPVPREQSADVHEAEAARVAGERAAARAAAADAEAARAAADTAAAAVASEEAARAEARRAARKRAERELQEEVDRRARAAAERAVREGAERIAREAAEARDREGAAMAAQNAAEEIARDEARRVEAELAQELAAELRTASTPEREADEPGQLERSLGPDELEQRKTSLREDEANRRAEQAEMAAQAASLLTELNRDSTSRPPLAAPRVAAPEPEPELAPHPQPHGDLGEKPLPAQPIPFVARDQADTAMLLRELSSLGFSGDDRPASSPPGGSRPVRVTPAPSPKPKKRKGLFGRG